MTLYRSLISALVASTLLALGATASAQTVANGPYYATPSWDQTLPVNTRFIVLANMNQEAVLDRETGLVWERSPDATPHTYYSGAFTCMGKTVGGRKGWRLPAMAEMMSLVDVTIPFPGPALPAGHPFINVQGTGYWTSWADPSGARMAMLMTFGGLSTINPPESERPVWCVRGAPTSGTQ